MDMTDDELLTAHRAIIAELARRNQDPVDRDNLTERLAVIWGEVKGQEVYRIVEFAHVGSQTIWMVKRGETPVFVSLSRETAVEWEPE